MQPDVTELLDFYERPLGAVVRRILAQQVRARWPRIPGSTLIGLGFASPYLGSFRGEVARLGAFMPATQGAAVWPQVGPVASVAVEEQHLPLPDNTVDHLLMMHCLEASENARLLLREIWRVMKPEGRLLVVVPNRRGVWARMDTTPFGHGRPYSSGQLQRLLAEALFTPLEWDTALYLPPVDRRAVLRSASTLERIGRRISPAFAGLIVVEARKELIAPLTEPVAARRLEALVPRGVSTARSEPGALTGWAGRCGRGRADEAGLTGPSSPGAGQSTKSQDIQLTVNGACAKIGGPDRQQPENRDDRLFLPRQRRADRRPS